MGLWGALGLESISSLVVIAFTVRIMFGAKVELEIAMTPYVQL